MTDELDFYECEISGYLRANGEKGEYWIYENAWTYLERVTPTPGGPHIEKLGTFNSADEAKLHAELVDVNS